MSGFRALKQLSAVVLLLSLASVGLSSTAAAEGAERPWGRLNKPSYTTPESSTGRDGYLGRYNPWGKKESSGASDKSAPRYREPEKDKYTKRKNTQRGNPYQAPYQQPYTPYGGGISPWGGMGYSREHGNLWLDPYQSYPPDTGGLWSDIYRW